MIKIENIAELSDIIPFNQEGRWYIRLIYNYEDDKGKHTVTIPKASVPFPQFNLPSVSYTAEHPYINCMDSMPLYEAVCKLAIERGINKPGCYFDIITEYNTREMTLDEIEKELGYKVKIVNKENK